MKAYVLVSSQTMETADVVEMMRKVKGVVCRRCDLWTL